MSSPLPDGERLSASLFRLIETSTDLIAVFEPGLRHVYCNERVAAFLRIPRDQILGRRYDELPMTTANAARMQAAIASVFATGEPTRIEVRGHRRDNGAATVFDISYHPEPGDDGRPLYVIGISREVTALRFAEERARASAERLELLLDSVDVAIAGIGRDLTIDFINRLGERELRALGAPDEPLHGRSIVEIVPPAVASGLLTTLNAVLASGEPRALEQEVEHAGAKRRFALQFRPERDHSGVVRGVVFVARDVTAQRQRELQLRLSERMVSLGRIAAGVAHEIANPLSAVYGNLELVRHAVDRLILERPAIAGETTAEIDEMLADARDGAERIRQIIEEIGQLVRADTGAAHRVDLREVVDRVVRVLAGPISIRSQLELRLAPVPEVAGSATQLAQVLTNLIENALQAMPPERPASANHIVIELAHEGAEIVLRVRDDGVGISPEALAHVFDPFFTTRAVNEGMGLGLTIAHGIVVGHRGTLRIESAPGVGSTVTMRLPVPSD